MAEAFIQILLENLNSLIQGEIGLIMSVNNEMKKLQSTLTTIQAVVEDAEEQQLKSHAIRNWLCKLNDLTYEIDDILDECSTRAAKLKYHNSKYSHYNPKNLLHRRKLGKRMKEVMEKLNVVAEERSKFHLREIVIEKQRNVTATRETGSVLNDREPVYGRDEEKEKIVNMLVNQARDRQELSVVPIVGIGGLGKTTLAQLVFNDPRVADHFGTKIWVCVSDNFDLKILIKAMIESLTGSGSVSSLERLDTLQRSLRELLSQKRYLLVLDDVWNEDQTLWFDLKNVLSCGASGASILLTTRIRKIADMMSTVQTQELTWLSTENCWELFKQRAFGQENEQYPNLEAIGKQIVNKCGGVPLAAKTLGGLLRFKRKENEWLNVKESEIWNLPQEETSILPALRLSYHHLPLNLRQCFAYCAVFPKDTVMEKEELIRLWIAHGYISSHQLSEVEDVGDEIWNELAMRSFFQDVTTLDTETRFRMHDLVHDLAQSIMENKVPGVQAESYPISAHNTKIRQVSLTTRIMAFPTNFLPDMDLSSVIKKFTNLRSLDGSGIILEDVPSTVGNLNHLRYLNLSRTEILTLPKSICSLWNLKILNLERCYRLVRLPKHLRNMRNLRHVYLEGCLALSEMPPKIGELAFLKTLSVFIVGHEKGNEIEELQFLNLGGTLHIKHLERVRNHVDAKKANLVEKRNICHLRLDWEAKSPSNSDENEEEKILEALEPHTNLQILEVLGFKGKRFPFWMENSTLDNIVRLKIWNCPNCLHLPQALGDFQSLKVLELGYLDMEYIIEDDVAHGNSSKPKFPSLERLDLSDLPDLKGLLKEETGHCFPNLHTLEIYHCFSLKLPHLSSLRQLSFGSCNATNLASISKLHSLEVLDLTIDMQGEVVPSETFENLTKLDSMTIRGEYLRYFARDDNFGDLVQFPEETTYPDGLTRLSIEGLTKMTCVPADVQYLTSLRDLTLKSLPELTLLPDCLDNCSSLYCLEIQDCPKLESLPDCVKYMENLEFLRIRGCPELQRRCEEENGEDWHKIAHIFSCFMS